MKRILLSVVAAMPLLAGCSSCRTTPSSEARAMLTTSNTPQESTGPLQRIHFAFDSAELSNESKAIIRDNLVWLNKHGATNVELGGNCDERGTNEYNMVLGMNRAQSAQNFIRVVGDDSIRFTSASYGEEMPVDPAHNEIAWAKNRSVEFGIK